MKKFRHKARLVAVVDMTKAPVITTYANLVSRETVKIALIIATLNDLDVKLGDILNAYVHEPVSEKVSTMLDP